MAWERGETADGGGRASRQKQQGWPILEQPRPASAESSEMRRKRKTKSSAIAEKLVVASAAAGVIKDACFLPGQMEMIDNGSVAAAVAAAGEVSYDEEEGTIMKDKKRRKKIR